MAKRCKYSDKKTGVLLCVIFMFGVCIGVFFANRNLSKCHYSRVIYMEAKP